METLEAEVAVEDLAVDRAASNARSKESASFIRNVCGVGFGRPEGLFSPLHARAPRLDHPSWISANAAIRAVKILIDQSPYSSTC